MKEIRECELSKESACSHVSDQLALVIKRVWGSREEEQKQDKLLHEAIPSEWLEKQDEHTLEDQLGVEISFYRFSCNEIPILPDCRNIPVI